MSEERGWRTLVSIAAILVLLANLALWVERGFADETRFAEMATVALERDDVRQAMAEALVREALADQPLLYRVAGNAAERAIADLLATPGMESTLRLMATHLHLMLVSDQRPTFTINSRILQAIALAVAFVAPAQAPSLSFEGRTMQVELFARQDIPSYSTHIRVVRILGLVSGLLALAILVGSVLASTQRGRALMRVAYALVAAFVLSLLLIVPLRRTLESSIEDDTARTIVMAVYRDLTGTLVLQTAVLLAIAAALWLVGRMRRGSGAGAAPATL